MDDLVTWLRAWLDEDERVARSLGDLADSTVRNGIESTAGRGVLDYLDHFAAPRMLAEVEAKRRILDGHVPTDDRAPERGEVCRTCHEDLCDGWEPDPLGHPCPTVRLLALPYADKPGYREEWRP